MLVLASSNNSRPLARRAAHVSDLAGDQNGAPGASSDASPRRQQLSAWAAFHRAQAPKTIGEMLSTDAALDAWFGKIQGKHRIIFDAPEPNDGLVAIWPRVYLTTMAATYPGTATAVVILRHGAIPLAMGDALWAKYGIGEMFKIKDGDATATKNPYATITGLPITGPRHRRIAQVGRTRGRLRRRTHYLQQRCEPRR